MEQIIRKAARVHPSARQLALQKLEFYAFVHFGVNTFTDREWGTGRENPEIFNPTQLDARQWVKAFKAAGMRMVILTCKHHDGFCLWPSKYTDHSVASSPWRGGRGDVVREVSTACRQAGLKFGVYLSPWDRHEKTYGQGEPYNRFFRNQLTELLTNYGPIACVWFDGACGEGPNGKRQVYDWQSYYALVRKLQPNATINIRGPDVRWCGNEAGRTRESEWSVIPLRRPPWSFTWGDMRGADLGSRRKLSHAEYLVWYPAEVNMSIRPGWFYHAGQDGKVKSLKRLLDVYYGSVGGNATFLLNVPPDKRGLIHENDVRRLAELGSVLRASFARDLAAGAAIQASATAGDGETYAAANVLDGRNDTWWMTDEGVTSATLTLTLSEPRTFNCAMLQEHILSGQRIERFRIEAMDGGKWRGLAEGTTVGYKRLVRFPAVTARKVRVRILESRLCPTLSRFALYRTVTEPPRQVRGGTSGR
ncbi:MAG: alpha-L-fucosidase [Planctomycetes bacterium]|nr:alpha-L-fucosidase [Planctomycetota bacterium]